MRSGGGGDHRVNPQASLSPRSVVGPRRLSRLPIVERQDVIDHSRMVEICDSLTGPQRNSYHAAEGVQKVRPSSDQLMSLAASALPSTSPSMR